MFYLLFCGFISTTIATPAVLPTGHPQPGQGYIAFPPLLSQWHRKTPNSSDGLKKKKRLFPGEEKSAF
jgi:hypothetical protein